MNPTYCVDGHTHPDEDSDWAGDGEYPPFRVFNVGAQDYEPGTYPTREAAQLEADRLNGAVGRAERESRAYQMGALSFECDITSNNNPFDADTSEEQAWYEGYAKAARIRRAEKRAEIADDYGDEAADYAFGDPHEPRSGHFYDTDESRAERRAMGFTALD